MVQKRVAGSMTVNESWGPTFKESGLEYASCANVDEALKTKADFFLIDAREAEWKDALLKLKSATSSPILSLVTSTIENQEIAKLLSKGASGCVLDITPPEEVVVRIRAMLRENRRSLESEARGAH